MSNPLDWPWWLSGAAIGLFVPLFAWVTGKALGISSGYAEMCSLRPGPERWKLWFVLGLPLGGALGAWLGGGLSAHTTVTRIGDALNLGTAGQMALIAFGGVLVGWGARRAGGCTSGHSIVGVAQGARSSIVATLLFLLAGLATANLLYRVIGSF